MKSSPSLWYYVEIVSKILSIVVAFLENMNFTYNDWISLQDFHAYSDLSSTHSLPLALALHIGGIYQFSVWSNQ